MDFHQRKKKKIGELKSLGVLEISNNGIKQTSASVPLWAFLHLTKFLKWTRWLVRLCPFTIDLLYGLACLDASASVQKTFHKKRMRSPFQHPLKQHHSPVLSRLPGHHQNNRLLRSQFFPNDVRQQQVHRWHRSSLLLTRFFSQRLLLPLGLYQIDLCSMFWVLTKFQIILPGLRLSRLMSHRIPSDPGSLHLRSILRRSRSKRIP